MTVFDPVDASSTYEETVERLGTAIRIGVLKAGSKLPPERELAEQLGISRSTLRQALATLTGSGHLSAVRGRLGGTFVSDDPPLASGSREARDSWRALLDWRLALEFGIVQLAAERASDEDHERLASAYETLQEAAAAGYARYRRADVAFHLTLAECSGSGRLVSGMTQLQGKLSDLLDTVEFAEGACERANHQHGRVLDGVRAGDAARALAEMREHLGATEQLIEDALQDNVRVG
jgi:GntR family transcriptional regulator, transcriptional repressor for pyruvate dehydrogenase complex